QPADPRRQPPQLLPARSVRSDDGRKIGREHESDDERVKGLLRPVEQHPSPDTTTGRAFLAASAHGFAGGRQTARSAIRPAATDSRETVISPPSVNACSRSRTRTKRSPPTSAQRATGSSWSGQ